MNSYEKAKNSIKNISLANSFINWLLIFRSYSLLYNSSTKAINMPGYILAPIDRLKIDENSLCPKCDGLLREAVQTIACGHRYCKSCVDIILR